MEYSGGTWTDNGFGDRGWLAVALVIFAMWKPVNAIWGSILFGALYILYLYIPGLGRSAQEIFKALPYVVTIIVLVVISFRKKKEDQPPEGLGQAYFRMFIEKIIAKLKRFIFGSKSTISDKLISKFYQSIFKFIKIQRFELTSNVFRINYWHIFII